MNVLRPGIAAGGSGKNRTEKIRAALDAAFKPAQLHVADESHLHAGHAGAATGRGHFRVEIVSAIFASKPLITRHRMVYAALGELMRTDIHALSIKARAPDES